MSAPASSSSSASDPAIGSGVGFLTDLKRSHSAGALRKSDIGAEVVLMGWVATRRDHGGRVFIDLRDREGITQVVFGPDVDAAAHQTAGELRSEFCIGIKGRVISRGDNVNAKLPTGEIEIEASALHIFSRSDTPPFDISGHHEAEAGEQVRLKHRYLDLRRPSLQKNFMVRSQLYRATREFLHANGFLEMETPFMVKYTPGGARNFLVPSRLNPGHFYALAESPQIFKQLFMVAGFDRYFQIVRCFRDEDLRQDRQPEFTQIDIEMSFVSEEDVFAAMEGLVTAIWKAVHPQVTVSFARIKYDDAMEKYGSDKPDLRFGLQLQDLTALLTPLQGGGVPLFAGALEQKGIIKALRVPAADASTLSRAETDKLEEFVKGFGARGLARCKVGENGEWTQTPLSKNITPEARAAINAALGTGAGDYVFFQFGRAKLVNAVLGGLRLHLGKKLGLIKSDGPPRSFLWVTDFPMFDHDEASGRYVAAHHPFTSPRPEDVPLLSSGQPGDLGRVKARAYDLTLDGNEIAGGSLRIYQRDVQAKVFAALGLKEEDFRAKFGFLLDAFKYGPPPHGGIAFGVDRLSMLLCGADSLRDVIAFPKTQKGTDLMTDAPTAVDNAQLEELFVAVHGVPGANPSAENG